MTHGRLQRVLLHPHTLFKQWGRHIHTHPLTPLDCLLWADVEVVCPTESADLIKTEETHHFIWLSLLFGLALIQ